jgi:hypothetical protein
MSHKLGRLFVPYALIAILVTSVVLASDGWIYGLALVGPNLHSRGAMRRLPGVEDRVGGPRDRSRSQCPCTPQ